MKTNYFEMVEKANTSKKALTTFLALEKNSSDGSKATAYLFHKMKNEKLYLEPTFNKFIENHKTSELKDFGKSTIYNYINTYKYVLVHDWSNELNFTQCYTITTLCKNGLDTKCRENIDTIKPMSIKELKEWCKQFSNGEKSNSSNQLENNNNNVDIVADLCTIREFITRHEKDKNIENVKKAFNEIVEKLDC